MAIDTTQSEAAPSNDASPGPAQPAQTPEPSKPSLGIDPIPPRIDSGNDIDNVLGEVSKIFGNATGNATPMSALAGDEINEHLSGLASAGSASPMSAPAGSSGEMEIGTAADLFRSVPEQPPADPPSESDEERPASETSAPARAMSEKFGEAKTFVEPIVASSKKAIAIAASLSSRDGRLRRLWGRVPHRARMPAGLAAALLMGWIAGACLGRAPAQMPAVESAAQEQPEGTAANASEETASKMAAVEEQLQKAVRERDAAQRDRELAVARMKQAEAAPRRVHEPAKKDVDRAQAARRAAEENFRRADAECRLAQRRTYDVQLARVRDLWRANPGLAVRLLDDPERCPAALRDFTWGYLHGRARNDRATLAGHAGPVNAIAWSPDGTQIVTCGQDGLIKFRDPSTGRETASVLAHAGGATAVNFSQRGELLASAGADGTVKLWNVGTRRIVATFFGHLGGVRGVAIAPDVSSMASCGDDGTVRIWDIASRRAKATRWGGGDPRSAESGGPDDAPASVRAVAYSPDGALVAAGGYRTVRVWETGTGTEKAALSVSEGTVTALAFSQSGTTLAAGTDKTIYHWTVDTLLPSSEPEPVNGPVNALTYSADGRLLAAAIEEGVLLIRQPSERQSADRKKTVARPIIVDRANSESFGPALLRGHVGAATGVALSPDAQTVVTCGQDGSVRFWNTEQGTVDKTQPDLVLRNQPRSAAIAWSPDGKRIAAAVAERITLWDARDGVETATLTNQSGPITKIAFSPDGALLASASKDWPIVIWDLAAQRVKTALNGHAASVNSLAYSPDGKILVSAGDDGTTRVWDATAGREVAALSGHAGPVLAAAVGPGGKFAASGGADRTIKLWDVAGKRELATLSGHLGPVIALAFSPDGRILVSAEGRLPGAGAGAAELTNTGQRPLRAWRLPKGELVENFGTAGAAVHDVAFSPDGKSLATTDRDGVTLWDAETFEIRETLRPGEPSAAWPVCFSPDGRTLAAGCETAIVLWNAAAFAPAGVAAAASR